MSQSTLFNYVSSNVTLETLVLKIAETKPYFTADDLHVLEPEIKRLHRDKRVLGAVLSSLKRKGVIVECGYVKSTRLVCHKRPVVRWKVRGRV